MTTPSGFSLPAVPKAENFLSERWPQPRVLEDDKYWRPNEVEFLRTNHGRLPTSEIARSLGRTRVAVRMKTKKLGLTHPNEWEHVLTVRGIAAAFGVDSKTAWNWACHVPVMPDGSGGFVDVPERGWPVRTLYYGNRPMVVVYRKTLGRWLADPLNLWWLLGRGGQIRDEHLRAIVDTAQRRWGDAWVSKGEVGQAFHVGHSTVQQWLNKGWLPGSVKYGNWRILRSQANAVGRERYGLPGAADGG